jgi:hypothetical protein
LQGELDLDGTAKIGAPLEFCSGESKRGNAMASKIMIVRQAKNREIRSNVQGEHDKNELSTQGWQRSGTLIRFFNPANGQFPGPAH